MHVTKSLALLFVYKTLFEKKQLLKEDVCEQLEINDLQFHRYMQDLRAFLQEFQPDCSVVYRKSLSIYVLEEYKEEQMD